MINKENFIQELKQGNMDALDYVLDNYSNLIYRVAFKVLNNKELSEECLNTVLLKIWEKANTYDEKESKFESWIFSIAKFCAIDLLRKEVRHFNTCEIGDRDFDSQDNIESTVEVKDDLNRVLKGIEDLGDPDREIFIKRFMMNLKVKDIALALGMTEKAVSLRILRGRKKLKTMLGEI